MKLSRSLPAIVLCLIPSAIFAAPPDAGQLLREQQPQRQMPQQLPKPEAELERAPLADTGIRIQVKGFRFSGYQGLVTEAELQSQASGVIDKNLSFAELQALADKITAYLKGKGWFLARAYLPKQYVTTGIIEIAIVNGELDSHSQINLKQPARIKSSVPQGIFDTYLSVGRPLNASDVERATLLLNDLPGVVARTTIEPGDRPGASRLVVNATEGPLLNSSIWGDNQGSRYTGQWRGNGMLNANDLTGYGDQLSLILTGAEGLIQGRAGYSIPIGSRGLKANLAYTGMSYELIGPLASLNGGGDAHTIDAGLTYPIIRRRTLNLNTNLGFTYKLLADDIDGTTIRDKNLQYGTVGFSGDIYDNLLGGGLNTWQFGTVIGNLDLTGTDADYQGDQLTARANGTYAKLTYAISRLQKITDSLTFAGSYSGQLALDNLDSSEKFNLGGPNGVRSYPTGEGSGDTGGIFTAELRYIPPLPVSWLGCQFTGFYDAGHITLHQTTWPNSVVTISGKNSYWLQGAGIGAALNIGAKANLKLTWAHALENNPGRGLNGQDADGRTETDRFWLQGMVYF